MDEEVHFGLGQEPLQFLSARQPCVLAQRQCERLSI
jgi:hypothetical protein